MLNKLSLQCQILCFQLNTKLMMIISKFFEYISKFMYLYLMDDYKRTEYRNQVANRLRELNRESTEDMDLARMKVIEFYAWMCKNQ